VQRIDGTVKLPGSKSLSNRILLLAALADGTTEIENLLVRTQHESARTSEAPITWPVVCLLSRSAH